KRTMLRTSTHTRQFGRFTQAAARCKSIFDNAAAWEAVRRGLRELADIFDLGLGMGEASRNRRRMLARLRAQPWCIYCGGVNEATTIDHMPPITIFDQRRRPRGLEFSACQPCNSGGRIAEKIVGLVSRMYPDPPNDTEELRRLYREFARYHPDL